VTKSNGLVAFFMDKKQILQNLQISGEIHKKEKTDNWKQAFDVYKSQSGDHQVSMDCGVCFAKVLKWLQA
jgi:hypothetical protein